MNLILKALDRQAQVCPQAIALAGLGVEISYAQLPARIDSLALRLAAGHGPVGLLMENSPAWALIDLAAMQARRPLLPLPQYFSDRQLRHALMSAGVAELITDDPGRILRIMGSRVGLNDGEDLRIGGQECRWLRLCDIAPVRLPGDTAKITFTSGTTGEPRGVCLSQAHMQQVAASLGQVAAARAEDRHLALLPLATLLENIGGLHVPLLNGARTELLPAVELGLTGSSGVDVSRLLVAMRRVRPSSLILVPQLLKALVRAAGNGARPPDSLRFVAVGGASLAPQLVEQAVKLGLPVHEGYGLSECASVLSLNPLGRQRPGSVGKPLPHVRLKFAGDGEILIEDSPFLGYLGESRGPQRTYASGDLGYLDADGYLYLSGRKKSMFVTAFGRNVAPEWIEEELMAQPDIAQAAVFGEARPWNVAVLQPAPGAARQCVDQVLALANARLPDYARVAAWVSADAPFSPANDQLTPNGRLRRDVIQGAYGRRLEQLYSTTHS